jgi:hypothetical protein
LHKNCEVRFQVLTGTRMKMTVFYDVMPWSLVETDQHFRGAYCLHHQGDDVGGNKHLWNVSQFLPDYTGLHPERQSSSYIKTNSKIPPDQNTLLQYAIWIINLI